MKHSKRSMGNSKSIKEIEHNSKMCKHKTFSGMIDGHCIKCGLAYKNCDECFPSKKYKACREEDYADKFTKMIKKYKGYTIKNKVFINADILTPTILMFMEIDNRLSKLSKDKV